MAEEEPKVINKMDLVKAAMEAGPLDNQAKARRMVNAIFKTIIMNVVDGNNVRITGFGSFNKVHRDARKGRNPSTGEMIEIPARDAVQFKVGKTFKDVVK